MLRQQRIYVQVSKQLLSVDVLEVFCVLYITLALCDYVMFFVKLINSLRAEISNH